MIDSKGISEITGWSCAAVLAEPLAIALHGIDRAAGRVVGSRCFVSAAGSIELFAATYVAISDLQPYALVAAGAIGIDETFNILQDEGSEPLDCDVSVEVEVAAACRSCWMQLVAAVR